MFQISDFAGDYFAALGRAQAFDRKVQSDASAISSNYAAVVALSVRQAFGALELTLSKKSDGSWNADDILIFLKGDIWLLSTKISCSDVKTPEISSDGVGDMLWSCGLLTFATAEREHCGCHDACVAHFLVRQSSTWKISTARPPRVPSYRSISQRLGCSRSWFVFYEESLRFPNFSYYELGKSYPNATGHNAGNDEAMPLEGDFLFYLHNSISQRLCFQSAAICLLWS